MRIVISRCYLTLQDDVILQTCLNNGLITGVFFVRHL